ncbi:MAG TPA: error-prone DNA polymerase [Gammaproteobacteria bacterium]|nr:error-prone DNA polymerase [Gammaproteobacteria bacterium]
MPTAAEPDYAELHCLSNFSFLRGASHPEELLRQAAALGYRALALTDECSLAGVVRAQVAAREGGCRLIVGSELRLDDGLRVVLLVPELAAYAALSRLISRARRRCEKGRYRLDRDDLAAAAQSSLLALWLPDLTPNADDGRWLAAHFPGRTWLAVERFYEGDDLARLQMLDALGRTLGLPRVAAGDVHMHVHGRRPLLDVLTAIRLKRPLQAVGGALFQNGERHLRPRARLSRLYPRALLDETIRIAERCRFGLEELRYVYPRELVPAGRTPTSHLAALTWRGAREHWPGGVPDEVAVQLTRELDLIAELGYEAFFLTVHDIVRYARSRDILCQGRGSAANSAVCYCLGITAVDPKRVRLLFGRFLSRERGEPPDIDVDFEHERREEVIQYVYRKYGRRRAALAATVISYRARSAIRDVGKALGLSVEQVDRIARNVYWWDDRTAIEERLREAGFDPELPVMKRLVALVAELIGFPRHLSQHVGGFVISDGPLDELVPIENAAMPERTVIQWDKDDLEALGLLKVDCLALGMLSAIRRALALVSARRGHDLTMTDIPEKDEDTYAMIQRADTIGVFQIESRAQMVMLPRLKPACYYDLVIEIAIVRPGPIQGDMVHPYLRRRNREEKVEPLKGEAAKVLERTLGVPLFQEQVIELAMVAAGFTAGEADQLRRSMAAWKRNGSLERFEAKLIEGMRARGYTQAFAQRLFKQIQGFGEYGFPESHAASFALLAYVSAWLKCHEPAAFVCALLNSQPMGFYAPAQLVQDARRHGVVVRPVDVRHSDWDCTLEPMDDGEPALRLGFRLVKGMAETAAARLVDARAAQPFAGFEDLVRRARLDRRDIAALGAAGGLAGLAGHRHRARWAALGVEAPLPALRETSIREAQPLLRKPSEGEDILADYQALGLSLGRHPLELLRPQLDRRGCVTAFEIQHLDHGARVRTAGLVVMRQRPGTATGVVFVSIEDETGTMNLVVWSSLVEAQRRELLGARLLGVEGEVQREGPVIHIVARRLADYTALLGRLPTASRDFH